jgi:hypothetical protein
MNAKCVEPVGVTFCNERRRVLPNGFVGKYMQIGKFNRGKHKQH